MAAPFIYCRSSIDGDNEDALLKAAFDGDLDRIKGIMKRLGVGIGNRAAVFSYTNKHGFGVLHCAAFQGHLEVCKYLVEELGGDPNIPAAATEGMPVDIDFGHGTPLFHAATVGQDKTLKILLDHHANPNFIFSGIGNPLMAALVNRSLKCMKLLIKAGADVNGKGTFTSPLLVATEQGGYTNFIQLLLKAGADPNIPDDLGRLPIELAALNDCTDEVEMLFPLTSPIPDLPNWSVDGVISHAKLKNEKPLDERQSNRRKAILKSQADMAFRRKEYDVASKIYDSLLDRAPDATLYSNRSLCKLLMGDGEGALSDAYQCRRMRPDWAKACYRQAAAHMLLKEYKQAHDALLDAQNLDPGNDERERATEGYGVDESQQRGMTIYLQHVLG
ncbi:unnamed protein product [Urochloa decumbens]|uniref:Serine/threonine-protein kinase BSK1-like TPR repeats domain-containing protein n=1 Tax=Urochloa decumbens TaxID=240449 RepID=A0ABC9GLZ0_9POAL